MQDRTDPNVAASAPVDIDAPKGAIPEAGLLGRGIDRIGNSSFALAGAAAVGDKRLATARSTMVLIDQERHRPTPITADLRASMQALYISADAADDDRIVGGMPGV